jgi:ribose 5-phosphate isomerase B
MTIYLGADHGGFELKEKIKLWLDEWGFKYQDQGALELNPDDDYPDFSFAVAEKVAAAESEATTGILLCRSGGGMVVAANKVPGIRAVLVSSAKEAVHAKEHDHANIISLAGDWTEPEVVKETVKAFLETPYSDAARHQRRVQKIKDYEAK